MKWLHLSAKSTRRLPIILCGICLFSLCSCGGTSSTSSEPNAETLPGVVDSTYFDGYMEKKDNHWYFSNGKSGEDGSCFFQVILLTRIRDKSNEEITMSADINTLSSCCDQYMFNDQEATGYISYGQPSFSHEYIDGNSPYLSIVVLKEDKPS